MNQKILTASLAALVLTTGAFSVQAESTPPNFYSLNEVVVTASRTPEKKIDTNADVAVVTAKEIEQKHFDDVAQAVKMYRAYSFPRMALVVRSGTAIRFISMVLQTSLSSWTG